MQSELFPSACMVELPSKPQLGRSARVGGLSNAFISVLPRNSGIGVLPSSQMYSNLYFFMVLLGAVSFGIPTFPTEPTLSAKSVDWGNTLTHRLCLWGRLKNTLQGAKKFCGV